MVQHHVPHIQLHLYYTAPVSSRLLIEAIMSNAVLGAASDFRFSPWIGLGGGLFWGVGSLVLVSAGATVVAYPLVASPDC